MKYTQSLFRIEVFGCAFDTEFRNGLFLILKPLMFWQNKLLQKLKLKEPKVQHFTYIQFSSDATPLNLRIQISFLKKNLIVVCSKQIFVRESKQTIKIPTLMFIWLKINTFIFMKKKSGFVDIRQGAGEQNIIFEMPHRKL